MPAVRRVPASATSANTPTYTPFSYRALRTEQGVFTTPPYSAHIKPHWRFVDEAAAKKSAERIWALFEAYRDQGDFAGMDIARKFLQMGRTRSLRYALRKGGRKYAKDDDKSASSQTRKVIRGGTQGRGDALAAGKVEMARTGEIYDEEKLMGADIFKSYEERCWEDETYKIAWED